MAKLTDTIKTSGMNSGAQVLGKMMRVSEIEEDPEISGMFQVHEDVYQAILTSMREKGFDIAQPPVLWKGKRTVVDGRTRVRAAKAAGLLEIPVVEREFETLDEAKLYCFKRQAERRNLTQSEIFTVAAELGLRVNHDGNGRSTDILAKELGVSSTVIKKARTVAKHGSEEDIQAVKKNELSINRAYEKLRKEKKSQEEDTREKPPETAQVSEEDFGAEEEAGFINSDILDDAIETEDMLIEPGLTGEHKEEKPNLDKNTATEMGSAFVKAIFELLIKNGEQGAVKIIVDNFGSHPFVEGIKKNYLDVFFGEVKGPPQFTLEGGKKEVSE
jgi:ParB-like chromosome segregation protein Spo0J